MKKISFLLFTFVIALFTACSDDMSDTYSQYAGDGPIRYTGRVTNIVVNPGWKCLRANWKLSKDPAVKNIRVTWISENSDTNSVDIAPTDTAYTIQGLDNENYQVMVQSVAQDGTPSLADKITRRPYTYEHEAVQAFTQGFNKYFLYHNHLLLFMGNWIDGIKQFVIDYTDSKGQPKSYELTQDVFEEKYVDIPDVDTTKPITLHRQGLIEGCPDVIDFQPVSLTRNVLMNSDFKKELRQHYGISNNDMDNFAATATSVDVDYDLYTLEDLLYFTKLKHVDLGAQRYMLDNHTAASSVVEKERSLWTIKKLHDIGGVEFNMYAGAYLGDDAPDFVHQHDVAHMPALNFYNTTGWRITTPQSDSGNKLLVNLLDDDASTDWRSWPAGETVRNFNLIIDMKAQKTVHGICVLQSDNSEMTDFEPANITVEYATADNPNKWNALNDIDEYTLGTAQGEATVIKAMKAVGARYLRATVKERTHNGVTRIALAEIKAY